LRNWNKRRFDTREIRKMEEIALLAGMTVIAAAVGTSTGFGISTIMIPVLSLWAPLPVALLFVGIIHLFGDIWKMILFKKGLDLRLALTFGVAGVAASYIGASLSFYAAHLPLKRMLGGFLLVYVVFLLIKRQWRLPKRPVTAVSGGALSGLFAGFFGIGGAVRSAFLAAFDLPKEVYLFTSGFVALFIDVTRITRYLIGGTRLESLLLYGLAVCVPVSFGGAYLAKRLLNRIPQHLFRTFVALFLALVGGKLLLWP
jgi:uncharacterized membrane protein YfcA